MTKWLNLSIETGWKQSSIGERLALSRDSLSESAAFVEHFETSIYARNEWVAGGSRYEHKER